jgi:hypothetical protein
MAPQVRTHPGTRPTERLGGQTVDTTKDSALAHPATRELRALALYHERGRDIERSCPDVYLVPSCTGEGVYRVDYAAESCSCPDHEIRGEVCKHVLAVGILRAKRRGATLRNSATACWRSAGASVARSGSKTMTRARPPPLERQ